MAKHRNITSRKMLKPVERGHIGAVAKGPFFYNVKAATQRALEMLDHIGVGVSAEVWLCAPDGTGDVRLVKPLVTVYLDQPLLNDVRRYDLDYARD